MDDRRDKGAPEVLAGQRAHLLDDALADVGITRSCHVNNGQIVLRLAPREVTQLVHVLRGRP